MRSLGALIGGAFLLGVQVAAIGYADPTTAPARTDVDPMDFIAPTSAPPLRERLTGASYDAPFAAALKSIDLQDAANGPVTGVLVNAVAAGSDAANLGLAAQDVLISIEGQPVHGVADWDNRRAAARDSQMVRVWTAATKEQKLILFPANLKGLTVADGFWRLDRQYVQSLPAGAKPTREMLVASACCATNPVLAETALARAKPAGERNLNLLAAVTAWNDLRFDDALSFGTIAMKEMPDDAWKLALMMRSAAILSFRWKLAVDLLQRYPSCGGDPSDAARIEPVLKNSITAFESLHTDEMPNPIEAFSRLKFQDQSADLSATNASVPPGELTTQLRSTHKMDFGNDGGPFNLSLAPTAANLDFASTCRFKPSGDQPPDPSGRLLQIGLVERSSGRLAMLIEFDDAPAATIYTANKTELLRIDLSRKMQVDKPFDFHIAAVGDRCEVVMNGTRLYYGPLFEEESSRQYAPYFHCDGMSCDFTGIRYRTAGPGGH